MGLDVWEHISPPLESTGVINYKFWKALEMTFHLVHSHFSVLNRWGVIRILVKILEARLRYRNFSRIFACKIFSAGLSILIMKTSRNSRCWVKWAFRLRLGCLYRRYSVFLLSLSFVHRDEIRSWNKYYLSKILIRCLPWDPWLPRCSKNLARSCQDSQDASKRVNPGSYVITASQIAR